MPGLNYKRTEITYEPTGPIARAALDLANKPNCFHNFGTDSHLLDVDELRKMAIALFEDRKVASATFSKVTPKTEHAKQPFMITFTPMTNGYSPRVEIDVKSVDELRAQAKLYASDATAYSGTRKPKRKGRRLDDTL